MGKLVFEPGKDGNERVPRWFMFLYGLPRFTKRAAYIFNSAFLTAMYERIGVPLSNLAFFMAAGRSVDVITDPGMGYLTDNWKGKGVAGRRRPFLFLGAPFYDVLWILFCAGGVVAIGTGLSGSAMSGYFGLFYICFFIFDTFASVPYYALGPELTMDGKERNYVFALQGILSQFGILVSAGMTAGLDTMGIMTLDQAIAFTGVFLAAVHFSSMWGTAATVVERPRVAAKKNDPFPALITRVFQNFPFMVMVVAWLCDYAVLGFLSSMTPLYIRFWVLQPAGTLSNVSDEGTTIGISLFALCAGAICSIPIWAKMSNWLGKRRTWLMYVIWNGFTNSTIALVALYVGEGNELESARKMILYATVFLNGTGVGGQFLGEAFFADTIDFDEFLVGTRVEGIYQTMNTLAPKVMLAFTMVIPLVTLSMVGYDPPVQVCEVRSASNAFCKWQPCAHHIELVPRMEIAKDTICHSPLEDCLTDDSDSGSWEAFHKSLQVADPPTWMPNTFTPGVGDKWWCRKDAQKGVDINAGASYISDDVKSWQTAALVIEGVTKVHVDSKGWVAAEADHLHVPTTWEPVDTPPPEGDYNVDLSTSPGIDDVDGVIKLQSGDSDFSMTNPYMLLTRLDEKNMGKLTRCVDGSGIPLTASGEDADGDSCDVVCQCGGAPIPQGNASMAVIFILFIPGPCIILAFGLWARVKYFPFFDVEEPPGCGWTGKSKEDIAKLRDSGQKDPCQWPFCRPHPVIGYEEGNKPTMGMVYLGIQKHKDGEWAKCPVTRWRVSIIDLTLLADADWEQIMSWMSFPRTVMRKLLVDDQTGQVVAKPNQQFEVLQKQQKTKQLFWWGIVVVLGLLTALFVPYIFIDPKYKCQFCLGDDCTAVPASEQGGIIFVQSSCFSALPENIPSLLFCCFGIALTWAIFMQMRMGVANKLVVSDTNRELLQQYLDSYRYVSPEEEERERREAEEAKRRAEEEAKAKEDEAKKKAQKKKSRKATKAKEPQADAETDIKPRKSRKPKSNSTASAEEATEGARQRRPSSQSVSSDSPPKKPKKSMKVEEAEEVVKKKKKPKKTDISTADAY